MCERVYSIHLSPGVSQCEGVYIHGGVLSGSLKGFQLLIQLSYYHFPKKQPSTVELLNVQFV
jgi:hypothetical protein